MADGSSTPVKLRDGDYILNMGAPPEATEELSYTPVTCDPDDFARSNYTLRNYSGGTELFILMTICDEDDILFGRTFNSVFRNVAHLCSLNQSKTWGSDGWKKAVFCIIFDGRSNIHENTLKTLESIKCHDSDRIEGAVHGKAVTAHIFECTTAVKVGEPPVEVKAHMIFCLKEQQKEKLNSHRWFFNAFCPLIMPKVCILLDVGTKLAHTSIYELWDCFEKHPGVGGACGELCVSSNLLAIPLAAAQDFEYKMSNIFDKPLESVFGYISDLPGAFSAYRYEALMNGPDDQGPLASYFRTETMRGGTKQAGLFDRNIYLAEDRILSFEIVTKKKKAWTLKYVKSAGATTGVPTSVPEFISQRQKLITGLLFVGIYATMSSNRIWASGQGFFRKLALQFLFIYNAIRLFFIWMNLASFYLVFFFLLGSVTVDSGPKNVPDPLSRHGVKIVFEVVLKLYISVLLLVLVCSLGNGNKPQESKWIYSTSTFLFGFCSLVAFAFAGYLAGTMNFPGETAILLIATYGMYFCSSLFHLDFRHMFTSFVQYIFFLPSYVNVLMVYAMCNLHNDTGDNDAIRGLGGEGKSEEATPLLPTSDEPSEHPRDAVVKRVDQNRNIRTNVLLVWLGTNMILIVAFTTSALFPWINEVKSTGSEPYLAFLYPLAGLTLVKFLGSVTYLVFGLFDHLSLPLTFLNPPEKNIRS